MMNKIKYTSTTMMRYSTTVLLDSFHPLYDANMYTNNNLSRNNDSCTLLNQLLKECRMSCIQSKIPTAIVPVIKLILMSKVDKLKKMLLSKICSKSNLSFYGPRYGSSNGLNLLTNLNLNNDLVNRWRTLNDTNITKMIKNMAKMIVNLPPNNSTLVSTDQNNCVCLLGR